MNNLTIKTLSLLDITDRSPLIKSPTIEFQATNVFVWKSFVNFWNAPTPHSVFNSRFRNFLDKVSVIDGNADFGAVYSLRMSKDFDCTYSRCLFDGVHSQGNGGAIESLGKAALRLHECTFHEITGTGEGGAVYANCDLFDIQCTSFVDCATVFTVHNVGGNAFSAKSTTNGYDVLIYKCASDDKYAGDGTFVFDRCLFSVSRINCSESCSMYSGTFGAYIKTHSKSRLSYCNTYGNKGATGLDQNDGFFVGNNVNFINNTQISKSLLNAAGGYIFIKHGAFFNNDKTYFSTYHGHIALEECVGDFTYPGVSEMFYISYFPASYPPLCIVLGEGIIDD